MLLLRRELVSPLLFQAHHFAGVCGTRQFDGSAEGPAHSVRLHGLLVALHLLIEVPSFLVQASIHQRTGDLLQEVMLAAQLLGIESRLHQ